MVWLTRDKRIIENIMQRFGLEGMTINRMTPIIIKEEDKPDLDKVVKLGYIELRHLAEPLAIHNNGTIV